MRQSVHFADRLMAAVDQKGAPICVGIDPVLEKLPDELWAGNAGADPDIDANQAVEAICRWVTGIYEAVAPYAACVKLQSACFERYMWPGVEAFHRLIDEAAEYDLLVINDAKRGDIGVSAAHYAAGCLSNSPLTGLGKIVGPDAITINSYLGSDSIEPFVEVAGREGKGLFALVRTSNPGSDELQTLPLADGRAVVDAVAQMIAKLGAAEEYIGECGYSLLGAVVGATKAEDAARLRDLMPQQIFLVPGFGAQGGSADDVRACFKQDGTGALITASRSIIYAHQKAPDVDWRTAVGDAAKLMNEQIREIIS